MKPPQHPPVVFLESYVAQNRSRYEYMISKFLAGGEHRADYLPDAADVVQDATVKAIRAWDTYDPTKPIGGWFTRIVYNTAISLKRTPHYRHRHGAVQYDDVADILETPCHSEGMFEEITARELPECVVEALAELEAEQREVVLAVSRSGGISNAARELNQTRSSVASQYRRALLLLKEKCGV